MHKKSLTAACAALMIAAMAIAPSVAIAAPVAGPGGPGTAGLPGLHNGITDVAGIQVGQVQAVGNGYLTGNTVIYTPDWAVAGADVRGGAPATKEIDLLSPLNSNPGVNAVALNGGSAFGLDANTGMMRWLEEQGKGVNVGAGVVPIVPGASIFDLNRGGTFNARPTADWGYRALVEANGNQIEQGTVGGGTGARAGGLKGGIGTASVTLADGTVVAAIVNINSVGSTIDPLDCSLLGARFELAGEFRGLKTPTAQECNPAAPVAAAADSLNTTLAVVATTAKLEKASAAKMAGVAHDGLARAINPLHTLSDGDSIIALSTGTTGATELANNVPADTGQLNRIYNAGADALSRAVVHAMINATSFTAPNGSVTLSYCDKYPSACADIAPLGIDTAVDIDPANPLGLPPVDPTDPTDPPASEPPASEPPASEPAASEPAASSAPAVNEGGPSDSAAAQPDGGATTTGEAAAVAPVGNASGPGGSPDGGLAMTGVQMLGTLLAIGGLMIGVGALTIWRPRIRTWFGSRVVAGGHH